jgi:hypothetical protein
MTSERLSLCRMMETGGMLGRPLQNMVTTATKKAEFNPRTFLSTIGKGRDMLSLQKKATIFAQGDATDGLFFIQEGKVQLSIVSEAGKEVSPFACLPPLP